MVIKCRSLRWSFKFKGLWPRTTHCFVHVGPGIKCLDIPYLETQLLRTLMAAPAMNRLYTQYEKYLGLPALLHTRLCALSGPL